MKIQRWIVFAALCAWGCDGAEAGAEMQEPTMTVPSAAPSPASPDASESPPRAEPTGVTEPATDPGQAGVGGVEVAPPVAPASPGGETADDRCLERRVSYAVPCYDDDDPCGIDSGWPGDEYCLLPPPTDEGIQIHIGPDDYADSAETGKYVLQPGEEFNNSVLGHIPLDDDVWFNRINVQMRPGSHHWISRVVAGRPEERVYDDTSCGEAQAIGSIGGGQNLIYDNPPKGVPAPENEGLGRPLPGNSSLCMNLHAYNFGDEPQLRELWINIHTVEESAVTQRARGIGIVGGLALAVPPGASETLTYTEVFESPGRIIQLFGHRHAWTPRFSVRLNGDLIYDSWDWQESVVFNYDSLTMNPAPDPDRMIDGAASGVVEVAAGDELTFSCFIENESDITLRFRNELYGGEMCNLWGSAVGTGLSANRF